jgi:hypothetical protein
MMDTEVKLIINQKILSLVDFIINKNPNADKGKINHKLNQLGLLWIPKIKINGTPAVITMIDKKPTIKVEKNQFSNYILCVEEDNHIFQDLLTNKFVMHVGSKTIIGTENSSGEIEPLTKALVEVCHKYKLKYQVPLNLNTSDDPDQDDVIVNEIQGLGLNYAESDEEEEIED